MKLNAHGLKIQGRGYLMFFAKIPRGVKAFRKNCLGGSPYFGFYCIFINKCFEICLRGVLYIPSPHLPPPCVHLCQIEPRNSSFILEDKGPLRRKRDKIMTRKQQKKINIEISIHKIELKNLSRTKP
jgi:hypothetical protein